MTSNNLKHAERSSNYEALTARNEGYIEAAIQDRLRHLRLLVAGCGLGSAFAEMTVRLGVEHFILADPDTVSVHNLNRQFYNADDIAKFKARALATRLKKINPRATCHEVTEGITEGNVHAIVAESDIIFDTIDFHELGAIVDLHDECKRQKKPMLTALALGWGGACIYFPPDCSVSLRQILGLPLSGSIKDIDRVGIFQAFIERLATRIDKQVLNAIMKAVTLMEDGKPCPASQIAPGSYTVASLAGTILYRIMAELDVMPAPNLLIADMNGPATTTGIGF